MNLKKYIIFIVCVAIPLLVGGVTGIITSKEVAGMWFQALQKPVFNPPDSVFGPVWTILYILMGVSLYLIWMSPNSEAKKQGLIIFALQLMFNSFWSILFFLFHFLFVAIVDIVILWGLIFYMIILFKKVKPTAGYLNVPYLLWVSFATLLNIAIWWLNK